MPQDQDKRHEQKAGQQNQDDNNRNRQQEQQDDRRSGSGNFANDPERASEAGRKGGQH